MSPYYSKPTERENLLSFGDGCDAKFITCQKSSKEGWMFFRFNPTPEMRWRKDIPDNHFSQNGRWIDKIYKEDLCFQISFDPDFPKWLILCDYYGNENTPMIDYFVKCRQLIERNRVLQEDKKTLKASLDYSMLRMRKRAEHPDEYKLKKLQHAKTIIDMTQRPQFNEFE